MIKLKKVSISLVLLSCFAVTSKVGAMNQGGTPTTSTLGLEKIDNFFRNLTPTEKEEFDKELEIMVDEIILKEKRPEKVEKEKISMGQKLQDPRAKKFSDIRINCVKLTK